MRAETESLHHEGTLHSHSVGPGWTLSTLVSSQSQTQGLGRLTAVCTDNIDHRCQCKSQPPELGLTPCESVNHLVTVSQCECDHGHPTKKTSHSSVSGSGLTPAALGRQGRPRPRAAGVRPEPEAESLRPVVISLIRAFRPTFLGNVSNPGLFPVIITHYLPVNTQESCFTLTFLDFLLRTLAYRSTEPKAKPVLWPSTGNRVTAPSGPYASHMIIFASHMMLMFVCT